MENKNLIFIGIIEDDKDRTTLKFLKNLLFQSGYTLGYSNENGNILCLRGKEEILVLIYIKPKDVKKFQEHMGINFNLLIYNFIGYENNIKEKFSKEQIGHCDYCILNGDYINLISYPLEQLKGIVVTYGFNNKSSLTVSSYDTNDSIKANLYLQRGLKTIKGGRIEPQEFTIKSSENHIDNIYSILAASTLSLVLGNNIWSSSPDNIIKVSI